MVASTESGAGEDAVPAYPISGEEMVPPNPKCGGGAEAIGTVADNPGTVDELT